MAEIWCQEGSAVRSKDGDRTIAIAITPGAAKAIVKARYAYLGMPKRASAAAAMSAAGWLDEGFTLDDFRRAMFDEALERAPTVRAAAELCGVNERTLYRYKEERAHE